MAAEPRPPSQGVSPVSGRSSAGRGRKIALAALLGGSLVGISTIMVLIGPSPKEGRQDQRPLNAERVGEIGARWEPIAPVPPPMPPPPPQAVPVAAPMPMAVPPPMPMGSGRGFGAGAPRRANSVVAFELTDNAPSGSKAPGSAQAIEVRQPGLAAPGQDTLGEKLRAGEDMDTAVASMLPDRNLFVTMGTPMACLPEQPINTDVPGPFRCKVQSPVYSTSGTVPLLDAGTWFVGRVSEQMRRGSRRAFAVMTRLETPQGCIVRLRAPVADQLGEAGLDGEVDTHFWQRFQGLAVAAFLDAASQAAATAAADALASSRGNGPSFNQFTMMGRQLGSGFQEDANIPPTLRRNQAQPILVMAMQDLDMRPCFRLQARETYR